ncbi:MAG: polysaccharide deacetylase family protein [bacterium]
MQNNHNFKSIDIFIAALFVLLLCTCIISVKQNRLVFDTTLSKTQTATTEKVVYLTFDADMTPSMKDRFVSGQVSSWYSSVLVSYLIENHIPATIFVTGIFAEMYPTVVTELGHTPDISIGNHTYNHSAFEKNCYGLSIISSEKEKITEIQKTQEILKHLIGYTPKYFRHPGLCHKYSDDLLVQKMNLIVSDTGLISGDAFNKNAKKIEKTVLQKVHNGSIVIMHLGGPNAPATEIAVVDIIKELKKQHYMLKQLP